MQVLVDLTAGCLDDESYWYELGRHDDDDGYPLPASSPRTVSDGGERWMDMLVTLHVMSCELDEIFFSSFISAPFPSHDVGFVYTRSGSSHAMFRRHGSLTHHLLIICMISLISLTASMVMTEGQIWSSIALSELKRFILFLSVWIVN